MEESQEVNSRSGGKSRKRKGQASVIDPKKRLLPKKKSKIATKEQNNGLPDNESMVVPETFIDRTGKEWTQLAQLHDHLELEQFGHFNGLRIEEKCADKVRLYCRDRRKFKCRYGAIYIWDTGVVYHREEYNHEIRGEMKIRMPKKLDDQRKKQPKKRIGRKDDIIVDNGHQNSINTVTEKEATENTVTEDGGITTHDTVDNNDVVEIEMEGSTVVDDAVVGTNDLNTVSVPATHTDKNGKEWRLLARVENEEERKRICRENGLKLDGKSGKKLWLTCTQRYKRHKDCPYTAVYLKELGALYDNGTGHNHEWSGSMIGGNNGRTEKTEKINNDGQRDEPKRQQKRPTVVDDAVVDLNTVSMPATHTDKNGKEWQLLARIESEADRKRICRENGIKLDGKSGKKLWLTCTQRYKRHMDCPYRAVYLEEPGAVYDNGMGHNHELGRGRMIGGNSGRTEKSDKINNDGQKDGPERREQQIENENSRLETRTAHSPEGNGRTNEEAEAPSNSNCTIAEGQQIAANSDGGYSLKSLESEFKKLTECRRPLAFWSENGVRFALASAEVNSKQIGRMLLFTDRDHRVDIHQFDGDKFMGHRMWPKAGGRDQFRRALRGLCAEYF